MTTLTAVLRPDGRLVDLQKRDAATVAKLEATGATVVPLARMPAGFGPFRYDAASNLAVPVERDDHELPERLLEALVVRAAGAGASTRAQAWAGRVLDAALLKVERSLSSRGAIT